jgi:hypothetical protein
MVARMLQVQTTSLVAGKLVLHSVSGALLTCCWAGSAWKAPVLCERPPTGDSATLTVVPLAMVDSVPLGDVMACSRAACRMFAMACHRLGSICPAASWIPAVAAACGAIKQTVAD